MAVRLTQDSSPVADLGSNALILSAIRFEHPMGMDRFCDRAGQIDSSAHEKCDRFERTVALGFVLTLRVLTRSAAGTSHSRRLRRT